MHVKLPFWLSRDNCFAIFGRLDLPIFFPEGEDLIERTPTIVQSSKPVLTRVLVEEASVDQLLKEELHIAKL